MDEGTERSAPAAEPGRGGVLAAPPRTPTDRLRGRRGKRMAAPPIGGSRGGTGGGALGWALLAVAVAPLVAVLAPLAAPAVAQRFGSPGMPNVGPPEAALFPDLAALQDRLEEQGWLVRG